MIVLIDMLKESDGNVEIQRIKLLSYSEDDDKYYFEFIVNQVKSIGVYS